MWCAHCQAEVAAEVAADNRRIRCATCGAQIDSVRAAPITDKTREARELLERWSSKRLLDPAGAPPRPELQARATQPGRVDADNSSPVGGPWGTWSGGTGEPPIPAGPALRPKSTVRLDRPHPEAFAGRSAGESDAETWEPPRGDRHAAPRIEPSHETTVPPPHFGIQPAAADAPARQTNWVSAAGQVLAYGGVLGLTVGTTLVLSAHFGGAAYQSYAPTGWLIATLGQMLMFLGVITIVSGGMEQTTQEVSRRIDALGDKLLRIEQSSRDHTLRGPTIPAERFADPKPTGGNPWDRESIHAATNAK